MSCISRAVLSMSTESRCPIQPLSFTTLPSCSLDLKKDNRNGVEEKVWWRRVWVGYSIRDTLAHNSNLLHISSSAVSLFLFKPREGAAKAVVAASGTWSQAPVGLGPSKYNRIEPGIKMCESPICTCKSILHTHTQTSLMILSHFWFSSLNWANIIFLPSLFMSLTDIAQGRRTHFLGNRELQSHIFLYMDFSF